MNRAPSLRTSLFLAACLLALAGCSAGGAHPIAGEYPASGTAAQFASFDTTGWPEKATGLKTRPAQEESMSDLFAEFVVSPTRENYLALAEIVANRSDYRPYLQDVFEEIETLGEQGRHAEQSERISEVIYGCLLCPRIHAYRGIVYRQMGDTERADLEHVIVDACLRGILSTGDGTEAAPYHVLSPSDEYDVLLRLGKTSAKQHLIEHGGRHFDVHLLTDGTEIWFDITPAFRSLDAAFAEPPA